MSANATSPEALSPQDEVLASIEQRKEANNREGRKSGLHTILGIAAYAAVSVLLPAASLLSFGAMLYTAWHGWDLVKEAGTERSLDKAKKEIAEDPTFEKTAARAVKEKKRHVLFENIMTGLSLTGVAAIITMVAAPLTVAAAIAAPLFLAAMTIGIGAGMVDMASRGGYRAAEAVSREGKELITTLKVAGLRAEAAKLKGPAAVANAPSPSLDFASAANGNAPPAADANDNTPVIKPDVPKFGS